MFFDFLLVLLFIDSVLLILVVLLQAGQGGGMAASFGGVSSSASTLFGARQAGNLLTKASWWCGGIFLGLAFVLSLASTRSRAPKSVLDNAFSQPAPVSVPQQGAPAAPAGSAGSVLPLTSQPAAAVPPAHDTGKAPAKGTGGAKKPPRS
ncbi:MAG TPA: preprotein translocase subunit SecG [Gemmatimonadaceae bacterium]|nr:preprotein translocase subunit SecG [Gemmatimonadaceae bacterium]